MTREPDRTDFDDIVASWEAEGGVPQWPEDDRLPDAADDGRDARGEPGPDPWSAGSSSGTEGPPTGAQGVPWPPADGPTLGGSGEVGQSPPPDRGADLDHADDLDHGAGLDHSPQPEKPAGPGVEPLADEHFVPPEPPPLPRLGPPMLVGITLIVLGLVLVTFPGWVGVPQLYGLPLGLVAVAAGLGWLVLRLWPDRDDGPPPLYLDDPDDPDGGAVL